MTHGLKAILLVLIYSTPLVAHENGIVLEGETLISDVLKRRVRFTAYLPSGYAEDKSRHYPVLYLLHGLPSRPHNSDTDWIQEGNADQILDDAIKERHVPPLVVIMPDAASSFYINNEAGDVRYESMFVWPTRQGIELRSVLYIAILVRPIECGSWPQAAVGQCCISSIFRSRFC